MTRKEVSPPAGAPPPKEAASVKPARGAGEARVAAGETRHRLVLISILLMAAALTTMLYVQFSVSALGAILAGAGACAILMLAHNQVSKSAEIARLKRELSRTQCVATAGAQNGPTPPPATVEPSKGAVQPAPDAAAARSARRRVSVLDPQAPDALQSAPSEPSADRSPMAHAASAGTSIRPQADPLRDQWAFRTSNPAIPMSPPPPGAYGDAVAMGPSSTIEGDLALVQRKIKALADEVNATEAARAGPPLPLFDPAPSSSEAAIESSIDALKSVGDAMRDRNRYGGLTSSMPAEPASLPAPALFEFSIPATAERIASSSPPSAAVSALPNLPSAEQLVPTANFPAAAPPSAAFDLPVFAAAPAAASPRVTAIMHAVEAGSMDVLLSPIVGLVNHDVSHFEMKVQLKYEDGSRIEAPESDLILAGPDVQALFDAARLQHAGNLARRLEARGKPGSLLSDVSGPSLTNGVFLETFARMYEERDSIAGQLVLTFAQADCEHFTQSAWQALADMNSFGFRFALGHVRHLDSEFDQLAQCGFAFVKLDAEALLTGTPSRDRIVQAGEVCSRIAGAGLTLMADGVDDEATSARLFGFGVQFGQGRLFGGARRISVDAASGATSSQAA